MDAYAYAQKCVHLRDDCMLDHGLCHVLHTLEQADYFHDWSPFLSLPTGPQCDGCLSAHGGCRYINQESETRRWVGSGVCLSVQWKLSVEDTTGTQLAVLCREVSLIWRSICMYTGLCCWVSSKVSSLERCPLFRVSFMERFHCMCIRACVRMYIY